ncbi:MAG: hypothetical protein JWN70_422 [Planctomycetaceae bacterium]|nr:hypothetical protein [Planctomycetaceae bacterium]
MKYEIRELGVSAILDQSFKLIQENFKLLAGITLPIVIPFALIQGFAQLAMMPAMPQNPNNPAAMKAFMQALLPMMFVLVPLFLIFMYVVIPITNAAMVYAISRSYLGLPTSVGDSFKFAVPRVLPLLWTWILLFLVILGGYLLCIVPGIIFSFWYALVTQIVVLEGPYGWEAMKRSKALMKGNMGNLFLLGLIVFLINFTAGGIAGLVWQPHLKAVLTAIIQGLGTMLGTASGVVFYFSTRCQHENFDLVLLAEAVAASDAPPPEAEPEAL